MCVRLATAVAATVCALAIPASTSAFFGNGAQIVSADFVRLEQGDDTTVFAAISANGRYVAIQTRARNFFGDEDADPLGQYRAGGVFRFDLDTKALVKVADGDLHQEDDNAFLRRGASNPSISADGRYIAFASAEQLVPADVNGNTDVYVRDLDVGIDQPGAFELVSVRDGGDVPASYGPPPQPLPGIDPGADATRGVGISADGNKVVFRTDAISDLPARPTVDASAGQVLVRDRAAKTTTLVTRTDPGGEPAGGAVGAGISADGTTVAWTGANAPAQTRFLGGENDDPSFLYYLWRRIADGPSAPTRRITGAADPDDPGCPPAAQTLFDESSTGPCYGPLTHPEAVRSSISAQVPAMSADGYRVAFLTGAGPRPNVTTAAGLDLYLTDMSPGLSRKQSTVELTRDSANADPTTSAPLSSLSMSSGGRYLAIASVRTRFTLPELHLLGNPRTVSGPRELYVVDLNDRSIDRVTRSYEAGDIDGDVLNGVTISGDGGRVAFASLAGNLFFGDANQRADAFVATRHPDPPAEPPPVVPGGGGPDGSVEVDPDRKGPRIVVRAKAKAKGVIELTVTVPAAGGVKAIATAKAGKPRRLRTLATATGRAKTRGKVRLTLRPVRRYRSELRTRKTIPGRVRVEFVASRGARRLTAAVGVKLRQRLR